MTAEEQEIEERGKANLAKMDLKPGEPEESPELKQATRTRKRRSDAGVKKGPKVREPIQPTWVVPVHINLDWRDTYELIVILAQNGKTETARIVARDLIDTVAADGEQKHIETLERKGAA